MDILLVDDEEWNVSKLRELLLQHRKPSFEVDYASMFDDAMTCLKEEHYDGLVTDFNMDHLNGKQLLRLLKGEIGDFNVLSDNPSLRDIRGFDAEIADVIESHFGDMNEYKTFVQHKKDLVYVLFSSSRYGDNEPDLIYENVLVAQKNNHDPDDFSAEKNILNYFLYCNNENNQQKKRL